MTFADYTTKVTETMKIRSTNYRLSSNDINYLMRDTFSEIATQVALDTIKQKVLIDKDTYVYDIQALYVPVNNELAMDVFAIEDDLGVDVSKFFVEIEPGVFSVSKYMLQDTNDNFLKSYDQQELTFHRDVIVDIETINYKQQLLVFPALIEGMMAKTHDSIPNPTSSGNPMQETAQHYTLYENAIKKLLNEIPQRR